MRRYVREEAHRKSAQSSSREGGGCLSKNTPDVTIPMPLFSKDGIGRERCVAWSFVEPVGGPVFCGMQHTLRHL